MIQAFLCDYRNPDVLSLPERHVYLAKRRDLLYNIR